MTGSRIIAECILEQGVDTVFGYPGGSVLPLYDALYEYSHRLRHILPAHEQGGAHAADGYARASGGVGVCIATSGPGATNLVTGIATAYMDSIPTVFITGNIDSGLIGTDCFQEVDITGVTMPITKHNMLVRDVNRLAQSMREAFNIAKSGRPGPVLIDIPRDIQLAPAEFEPYSAAAPVFTAPSPKRIVAALELIAKAKRPVILAGGGVIRSGASSELAALAERLDAPVGCTLMGLGAVPASHPLSLGFVGMHGNARANAALAECDLVIAVGTRFSERMIGGQCYLKEHARLLHIDIDRAEIGKNVPADGYITGDAANVLSKLSGMLPRKRHGAWTARIAELREQYRPSAESFPEALMRAVRPALGPDATVVTDVGQHQMWAAANIPCEKPLTFITSGGTGTMGYGLGAAIGVQLARPDSVVLLITGDGGLRMSMGELSTMAAHNLPIIIALINNSSLGMVRQLQTLFCGGRLSGVELGEHVDYVKLAAAFGIPGRVVTDPGTFARELRGAAQQRRAALLDCRVNAEELVRPMSRPGGATDDFIL